MFFRVDLFNSSLYSALICDRLVSNLPICLSCNNPEKYHQATFLKDFYRAFAFITQAKSQATFPEQRSQNTKEAIEAKYVAEHGVRAHKCGAISSQISVCSYT